MFNLGTAIVLTDSGAEGCGGEQADRCHHRPRPMDPVWRKRIAPGALDRQPHDPQADVAVALDLRFVRPDPGADVPADGPGGMVPAPHQAPCPCGGHAVTDPGAPGGGDRAHGPAVDNAPPDRLGIRLH